MSDLDLHCLPMPHKRTLGLYGLNVYNINETHILLIKTLNASTKRKEDGKDQALQLYHYLNGLEIAWTYIGLKTSGEL